MSYYTFEFELTGDPDGQGLRAWVDGESADLRSERELSLTRRGGCWTAHFEQDEHDHANMLWLRLAVIGQPGATWRLHLSSDEAPNAPILTDADALSLAKEWLVATCHLPPRHPRLHTPRRASI